MQGKQFCALRIQEKGWLPFEEIDIDGIDSTETHKFIPDLEVLK